MLRRKLPVSTLVMVAVAIVTATGLLSCIDPVHSDEVDALGPEAPGVRVGPLHRPGQPCGVCHGGLGPGPDFIAAGTIYDQQGSTNPLAGVTVNLSDKTGKQFSETTNQAGNFFINSRGTLPTPPMKASLVDANGFAKEMETQIGRNGHCGACHRAYPGNPNDGAARQAWERSHVVPVYLKGFNEL